MDKLEVQYNGNTHKRPMRDGPTMSTNYFEARVGDIKTSFKLHIHGTEGVNVAEDSTSFFWQGYVFQISLKEKSYMKLQVDKIPYKFAFALGAEISFEKTINEWVYIINGPQIMYLGKDTEYIDYDKAKLSNRPTFKEKGANKLTFKFKMKIDELEQDFRISRGEGGGPYPGEVNMYEEVPKSWKDYKINLANNLSTIFVTFITKDSANLINSLAPPPKK